MVFNKEDRMRERSGSNSPEKDNIVKFAPEKIEKDNKKKGGQQKQRKNIQISDDEEE